MSDQKELEHACETLHHHLLKSGVYFIGVATQEKSGRLLVYITKTTDVRKVPTEWEDFNVVTQVTSKPKLL